jgi:hypothetical protein
LCLAAVALAIGMRPISDNSLLTHLATGRLIVHDGHIPTVDPYSFTAHGHAWVVQSWLASVLLGLADKAWGLDGVRLLLGLLTVAVFAVVWRLARPTQSVLVRVGIGAIVLGIAAEEWDGRPLLIGLLALALTVLAAEGDLDPRWLVPIGWVWVNTHGSFPLGVVYLLVVGLGRRLDDLDASIELRCLRWLVAGLVLGAVNPLGPKLLVFPLQLLHRQDVLRHVIEWQAPAFQTWGQRLFLLEVVLAILAVARLRRYRSALVLAVFLAAALLGSRNITVASIVLVPVLASAWPDVGELRTGTHTTVASALGGVAVVGLLLTPVARLGEPGLALSAYPIRSLDYLDREGVDLNLVHLVSTDAVGNLIELRYGAGRRAFFDDRFDMYPRAVADDEFTLAFGRPTAVGVLDRWSIDLALWPDQAPMASILEASGRWRIIDRDDRGWLLMCRRGATLSSALGTC